MIFNESISMLNRRYNWMQWSTLFRRRNKWIRLRGRSTGNGEITSLTIFASRNECLYRRSPYRRSWKKGLRSEIWKKSTAKERRWGWFWFYYLLPPFQCEVIELEIWICGDGYSHEYYYSLMSPISQCDVVFPITHSVLGSLRYYYIFGWTILFSCSNTNW